MNTRFLLAIIIIVSAAATLRSQTTSFVYQGNLTNGGNLASGSFDFEFALFDASSGGTQIAGTLTQLNVAVVSGQFSTPLDFGNSFPGADRFVEIRVRPAGGGAFTLLTPRQQVNSIPYSIRSLSTDTAANAQQLGGISAAQYILQGAATINAATEFSINGSRVLSIGGTNNLFAGVSSGLSNTSGVANAFFGTFSGQNNTTGGSNSFFGSSAGFSNVSGAENSFFGTSAGSQNTAGSFNTFVGSFAGFGNTSGLNNSFFGREAGLANTTGSLNSFFGSGAGDSNTTGLANSFFGRFAGSANVTASSNSFFGNSAGEDHVSGNDNSFFGARAGDSDVSGVANSFFGALAGRTNMTGSGNTFIGRAAGLFNSQGMNNTFVGENAGNANGVGNNNTILGHSATLSLSNLSFATAIGSDSVASASNSIVLGRSAGQDLVRIPGNLALTGELSLNANTNFNGQRLLAVGPGANSLYLGNNSGLSASGTDNSFFGTTSGSNTTTGNLNSFFGSGSGSSNSSGSGNSYFGANANGSAGIVNAAAIGFRSFVTQSHSIVLGGVAGVNNAEVDSIVGIGVNAPRAKLHIASNGGNVLLGTLGCSTGFTGISFASNQDACQNYAMIGNGTDTILNRLTGGSIFFRESNSNQMTIAAGGNIGVGTTSPSEKLHIAVNSGNLLLGDAGCPAGATAIGFASPMANCSNYAVRGDASDLYFNRPTGGDILFREQNGSTQFRIRSGGVVAVTTLGDAGATALCRNASNDISTCSSSARYKSDIYSFTAGLELVRRLRPVSFTWTVGSMSDMGLVAEEVAKIEPLLTTKNDKGEIEGVKYDRVGVLLINAVKEQQAQIEAQQKENKDLRAELAAQRMELASLRAYICSQTPAATVCPADQTK